MIKKITKTSDYKNLYKNGLPHKSRYFICIIELTDQKGLEFGITVSRKIGNAVIRNKLKRQLKHIIHNNKESFSELSMRVNLIAKKYAANVEYAKIEEDVKYILNKIGSSKQKA